MEKVFQRAMDDMALAMRLLQESEFGQIIGTRKLLCEIYYSASVGEHTFFLQIYDGEPCLLVRTWPKISDYLGLRTGGCAFSEALKAERHPARRGDIYHSVKYMPKEATFLQELFSCLPLIDEFAAHPGFTLDGITCLIRDHRFGRSVCLGFQNTEDIVKNVFSDEQKEFLYRLFKHVEQAWHQNS